LAGSSNFKVTDYEVYQIDDPDSDKIQSNIINVTETKQLMKWIKDSNKYKFRLLFRGSRDGFAASTFHKRCNGRGPNISIIKSTNNHVFGGYSQQSWHSNGNYTRDDNAWLYSLRNTKGDPKVLKIVKNQQNAIYGNSGYGPTYGGNHDLYIANNCNSNTSSYTNLGNAYNGETDKYQLTGSNSFKVEDYEIWDMILRPESTQIQSSILRGQEVAKLNEWIKASGNSKYRLLFRASRDGFKAETFHQKCDGKGKTLVIVQSTKNHVFGGYTEKLWHNAGCYQYDSNAWIYLLRSSRGDQPEKWTATIYPNNAIYGNGGYGPTFGGGHDIYLANNCNNGGGSYSNFGNTYSGNSDRNKLAGEYNFKVTDYEVWLVS